ncbi:MAG: flagellar motor switch protein FliN [Nocardioidaceae bacterium]|jgi:flagellar motor switch protein FliN/FliY|nr:flagellar motor switch protein FliN [Nocardioidaceae bacterium]
MTTVPDAFAATLPGGLSPAAAACATSLDKAATAAAEVLPAVAPLTPGRPEPGDPGMPATFAGAAIAEFEGTTPGALAVLVGADLVQALASSPLGSLDLAAAVQPALDGAAAALGGRVGAARTVPIELAVNDLGFPFTVVPLVAEPGTATGQAALLVTDTSLETHAATLQAAAAASGAGKSAGSVTVAPIARGLEMLHGVIMDVTVELGRTRMSVRELLALSPGTVLELDRAAGSPADLLVNGRLIARGEVVVVDEDFGLRVTEIVDDAAAS